jgi:hypothetical protein
MYITVFLHDHVVVVVDFIHHLLKLKYAVRSNQIYFTCIDLDMHVHVIIMIIILLFDATHA